MQHREQIEPEESFNVDKQGNLIKKLKKKKRRTTLGATHGIPSAVHLTFGLAARGILPNYFEMFPPGKGGRDNKELLYLSCQTALGFKSTADAGMLAPFSSGFLAAQPWLFVKGRARGRHSLPPH